jgi:hypothetical protein
LGGSIALSKCIMLGWARRTKIQRSFLAHIYFTKFWMGVAKSLPNAPILSDNGHLIRPLGLSMAQWSDQWPHCWSDHQVFQWPLIRPPSLCRWPRIRPLCNNPNGHDQTFQSSHIRETTRVLPNDHWSVGGQLNRPLGYLLPMGPLIRLLGLLSMNGHWSDHWDLPMAIWSDSWILSNDSLPGSSPRAAHFCLWHTLHAYILDSCQVWSGKTIYPSLLAGCFGNYWLHRVRGQRGKLWHCNCFNN